MRETVSNLVRHRLITADGVQRVLCDQLCVDRWLVANGARDHRATHDTEPVRIQATCAQCAWCGETAAVPIDCLLHDNVTCPDFDVLATAVGERAVTLLQRLARCELPARAYAYLADAADHLRDMDLPLSPDLLVARVWDVRCDWLP